TLQGSNSNASWKITGPDTGTLGNVSFSSVGNLIGGSGQDTFAFSDNAVVSGTIDGGGGKDTIDWSAYMSGRHGTLIGAGGVDGFAGSESSIVGGFTDIDSLVGGAGQDTLTGLNAPATWTLLATDTYASTNTLTFSGFENLVGGSGPDRFVAGVSSNVTV